MSTRSSHSTRLKARGRAWVPGDLGLQGERPEPEQNKVKTSQAIWLSTIARAKALAKAKARRDSRPQGEKQELETNRGTFPSVRAGEQQRELEKLATNLGT